jgi:hypothetical protein
MKRGEPVRCRTVRDCLPLLDTPELPAWRARAVRSHLRRCEACAAAAETQDAVSGGLEALRTAPVTPPPELLDELLDRVEAPTRRESLTRPVRAVVSGARPAVTGMVLVAAAVTGSGAGWALRRKRKG